MEFILTYRTNNSVGYGVMTICGAQPGTCKECKFSSYYCRQIHEIANVEEKVFLNTEVEDE